MNEDDEAEIIDSFLNSLISSELHEDEMVGALDEKPYVLKSNDLCKTIGNKEHLNDVFMQVDEEMKLPEEMVEIEKFLVEYVFKDNEDGQ